MSEDVLVEVPSDSSGILLDARKPSSAVKICSTLQFSIQDLKLRQQRLSQLQSSNSLCQRTKTERSIKLQFLLQVGRYMIVPCCLRYIQMVI